MALTLEQIEDKLKTLEEERRKLRAVNRNINPFDNLEFQLALENGSTVSARTRNYPLSLLGGNYDFVGVEWDDTVTDDVIVSTPVPADWVVGTDIIVTVQFVAAASGTVAMDSFLGVNKAGDTFDNQNIDNAASMSKALTINIVTETDRTIAGASIEAADVIIWRIRRRGGAAGDTVNDIVDFLGAWISYTAFF